MADRTAAIDQFLKSHGWDEAERQPLASDASFRRYIRLTRGNDTTLLMDAPPPKESVGPFTRIAKHLLSLGLSAPEIYAEDRKNGLLLIEDFGENTFTTLLNNGADETALYQLAIDTLIELHKLPTSKAVPEGLPAYNFQRLNDEASLLVDWFVPAVTDTPISAKNRKDHVMAWFECYHHLFDQPQTLVLRDYHVDNLMQLDGRKDVQACGLLDFQDALVGPSAYDVMSLLEDARRDISDTLKSQMLERYLNAFPDLNHENFSTAFAILGAQRHAKVIGIFTRLCWRDNKSTYLQHIPRVWRLLEHALQHPSLAPIANWLEHHIPPDKRIMPPTPQSV